ncbi:sensor histidine kinase [Halorubrum trueperi]|uniref:histidine kinase n=1 Tax=Halorubrum trueperi TaxID=2004704 RepID=A0ABD5UHF3_9EURY
MARMIDELHTLTMSHRHGGDTTTVTIADRAEAAWATTETEEGCLEIYLDREHRCEANIGLLDHIFENLFRNAVVHNDAPVTVTVGSLAEGSGFYVADDGDGIPSDRVDSIFEYGYSTAGRDSISGSSETVRLE